MPSLIALLFLVLVSSYITTMIQGRFLEQSHIILPTERAERFTHLHYYVHDILDGEHPTSIKIVYPPKNSPGGFGVTFMVDSPLTEGPEPSSKLVGRAQGTYALASQHDVALKMVINFYFTEGDYEGSALSMLGRDAALDEVRELPIVGGNGAFRLARGHALIKTIWSNSTSGGAIIEYNVSVYHA